MSIIERLRKHALPDPHDEREVMHAPLLREAADLIEQQAARIVELEAAMPLYDELFIRCAIAEKDLAALRQRIADAPVVAEVSSWWNGGTGFDLCNFKGKRPEPGAKLIIKEDLL